MRKLARWVALDVHADTIAIAVADGDAEPRSLGVIPNERGAIQKLMKRLSAEAKLRVCYEAGPCGYEIYWQLVELGIHCDVIAPSLIPVKSGDRVKTDRRDALRNVRCYRSGDLTSVWVPDREHEALRELVRLRWKAKKDEHRSRRRLTQFLMLHGHRKPQGMTAWRCRHLAWVREREFGHVDLAVVRDELFAEAEHQTKRIEFIEMRIDAAIEAAPQRTRDVIKALQSLRGVATVVAATIVAELGSLSRFDKPSQLMAYSGVVPSERSSGDHVRRGRITKTGNAYLRRVIVESAWAYRGAPRLYRELKKRQTGADPRVCEISWKAQLRLCRRFRKLLDAGKPKPRVMTAVARELLGFVWAIGVHVEQPFLTANAA